MRIISQNGIYDLPYDKCFVWLNKNNIMASPIGEPDSDYTMAIYSTPQKAERVMQLLHQAYIVHENFKEMDAKIQFETLKKVDEKKQLTYGGIFQFPKEEDL